MEGQLLSKWWQTPSAKAAMERAKNKRNDALNQLKARTAAHKAQLVKDANDWQVVESVKPGLSKSELDEAFTSEVRS